MIHEFGPTLPAPGVPLAVASLAMERQSGLMAIEWVTGSLSGSVAEPAMLCEYEKPFGAFGRLIGSLEKTGGLAPAVGTLT